MLQVHPAKMTTIRLKHSSVPAPTDWSTTDLLIILFVLSTAVFFTGCIKISPLGVIKTAWTFKGEPQHWVEPREKTRSRYRLLSVSTSGSAAGEEQWQEEDQSSHRFANILHGLSNIQSTQQVAFQVSAEFQFQKFQACAKSSQVQFFLVLSLNATSTSSNAQMCLCTSSHVCPVLQPHTDSDAQRCWCGVASGGGELQQSASRVNWWWVWLQWRPVRWKRREDVFAWQTAGLAYGFLHTTPTDDIRHLGGSDSSENWICICWHCSATKEAALLWVCCKVKAIFRKFPQLQFAGVSTKWWKADNLQRLKSLPVRPHCVEDEGTKHFSINLHFQVVCCLESFL